MPAVTRLGDMASGHADGFPEHPSITASPNVFANGIMVVKVTSQYQTHSNGITSHSGNLSQGSPNVFVNGQQIGRIGDPVSCGGVVIEGSPNIFAN